MLEKLGISLLLLEDVLGNTSSGGGGSELGWGGLGSLGGGSLCGCSLGGGLGGGGFLGFGGGGSLLSFLRWPKTKHTIISMMLVSYRAQDPHAVKPSQRRQQMLGNY